MLPHYLAKFVQPTYTIHTNDSKIWPTCLKSVTLLIA